MTRPLLLVVSAMAQETQGLGALLNLEPSLPLEVDFEVIGIGKVDAAAHTAILIAHRRPRWMILVGVAGALRPELRLGDVLLVTDAIDADLDVRAWRPGYQRGEHPLTRERIYKSDTALADLVRAEAPGCAAGLVATGSAFLDEEGKRQFRRDVIPLLSTPEEAPALIDMETSAFLQVCHRLQIPALALRSVSDTLEGDAAADFEAFLRSATQSYAPLLRGVIRRLAAQA